MSSKVLKSQRISKKPAVDCLLIGQNPLKLARSVLGRIWISDQPRSQTGTLATQHGLPRPQIVLYALPTSPKNTFLNFCGDLRQVLTMGKLMVHPALARFWQKTGFPKITKIKILTFFFSKFTFSIHPVRPFSRLPSSQKQLLSVPRTAWKPLCRARRTKNKIEIFQIFEN